MLSDIEKTAFELLRENLRNRCEDDSYFLVDDPTLVEGDGKKGFTLQTTDGRFHITLYEDGTFNIGDFYWAEGRVNY